MTLREKQSIFAYKAGQLIHKAYELGYVVTLGDAYRDPRVHGEMGKKVAYGDADSCHKLRLAIDLNLFKDGVFLTDGTGHTELGAWWKLQHPDACWGGDFKSKDWNHYSFSHEGNK